jgi:ribose 5-phosphate isomerase B
MRIAKGRGHAAVSLKAALAGGVRSQGHEVDDLGADGEASVCNPELGCRLASHVAAAKAQPRLTPGAVGIRVPIAVNRRARPRARCARVSEPLSALLSREHNDAKVIAMGAHDRHRNREGLPKGVPHDAVRQRATWATGGQAREATRLRAR